MVYLEQNLDGKVKINGQVYLRGLLRATYGMAGGQPVVTVVDPWGLVLSRVPWAGFLDATTGRPFGSFRELQQFVQVNWYTGGGVGARPSGYDGAAQQFFNYLADNNISITEAQKTAINNLVLGLKAGGAWFKMTALYPFVGGTAASHAVNLMAPGGPYDLTFYGAPGHSANGVQFNGTSSFADTSLADAALPQNDIHMAFYSRIDTGTTLMVDAGAGYNGVSYTHLAFGNGGRIYFPLNSGSEMSIANPLTTTRGMVQASRPDSIFQQLTVNGSAPQQIYTPSVAPASLSTFIGCINIGGTPSNFSSKEFALFSKGRALTPAEAAAYYTTTQAYQSELGRQV